MKTIALIDTHLWTSGVPSKMKNEITYKPQNDATFGQQSGLHADFTYSIRGNVISIIDLNLGNRSVTNDVENVLRKIEHFHQTPIFGLKIITAIPRAYGMALNGMGSILHSSRLRETDESQARHKLLNRKE